MQNSQQGKQAEKPRLGTKFFQMDQRARFKQPQPKRNEKGTA